MSGTMGLLVICITSFLASLLTLFSGFGLGTLLMPVIAVFLPVPVAIAITALVHWLSKIFKLALLWRYVDRRTLLHFGIPALFAAIPGALLLTALSVAEPLAHYYWLGQERLVTPVKLVAGLLLLFFATADWIPFINNATRRMGMPLGGALSGFFGGLTGHQGAFRSAFLLQQNLSERSFVATHAAIAVMVDSARLLVYGLTFKWSTMAGHLDTIIAASLSAFLGIYLGAAFLKKVTMRFIQRLVAAMMYALGIGLIAGVI